MRRIIPLLLGVSMILMAAGTWVSDITLPAADKHPVTGALEKPRNVGEMPKVLDSYQVGAVSRTADGLLSIGPINERTIELMPTTGGTDAPDSIYYDGPPYTGIGLVSGGTFYTAVRFTPQVNCTLTGIKIYQTSGQNVSAPGYFYIWQNSGGLPGAVLESIAYTNSPGTWIITNPTVKRYFASGTDFFLGARWTHTAGSYPAGADAGPMVANREYIALGSPPVWQVMPLNYNWNCRALVNTVVQDPDMMAVSVDGITSPERPNQWLTIKTTVKNVGTTTRPAGVPVRLLITGPGGYVYQDIDQVTSLSLAPGATEQITFTPNWRTPATLGNYSIKAYTALPGDANPANDTARYTLEVTNWLTYADWNVSYWITWGGPKRGTFFDMVDFGVAYPVTIESLKHEFYHHSAYPWGADTTFQFRIYGNNFTNLLYASPTLHVSCPTGQQRTVKHRLTTPVTVTSGLFIVAVCPTNQSSGNPSSLADQTFKNRSIVGDTTQWYWWNLGEFHNAVFVTWTAPANDVGFYKINIPWMIVEPGAPVTPRGTIRNFGTNNQSAVPCSVFVEDTTTDAIIYRGYASVSCIAGETAHVAFSPPWTPPSYNNYYGVTMETFLAGDGNPANNWQFHDFMGFRVQDPLTAPSTTLPPTIDGHIQTAEWADANRYDISNVLGWNDANYRYLPGNVWLYLKHDANFLYMAYDIVYQDSVNDSTELGIYFDDNNDGVWANDSSEGNYFALHRPLAAPPIDSILFRWIRPGPVTGRVRARGAQSIASYTSGHEQFEIKIPIGAPKCSLNVNPDGDTCGLWTFFLNEEGAKQEWRGYWKTTMDPAYAFNPAYYGKLVFAPPIPPDVGVKGITSPTGTYDTSATITPKAWFKNYGTVAASFTGFFRILDAGGTEVYNQSTGLTLLAGDSIQYTFPDWPKPHATGGYTTRCSTYCAGDVNPANNVATGSFTVIAISGDTGWKAMAPVPAGPKGKNPKDGCCMAYCVESDTDYVYLLKGNGRYEFYKYNTETNTWATKESIPAIGRSGKKKAVKKGATMAQCAALHKIYAAKGNNSLEWWEYDPSLSGTATYPWTQKADIPSGAKSVKEGAGAVAVQLGDTNWIYLLKGSGTQEFYRYNTATDIWETKTVAPLGISGKPYKNGSALAVDEATPNALIWALKGSLNEMFVYDIATDVWTQKATLPFIGSSGKKKKAKDGAGLAYHGGFVYALKGGNSNEFWKYEADSDRWTQLSDVPAGSGKNVKGGGAIVYVASKTALYVTKGNNTPDFFRYGLAADFAGGSTAAPNISADVTPVVSYELKAVPNPFSGRLLVNYALPKAGNVTLKVYDVTGKVVSVLAQGRVEAGRYTAQLDGTQMARGIYLLKLQSDDYLSTCKLILE